MIDNKAQDIGTDANAKWIRTGKYMKTLCVKSAERTATRFSIGGDIFVKSVV